MGLPSKKIVKCFRDLQVREADLVDVGRGVVTYPDALAVTVHVQTFGIVDVRHGVAFLNFALQRAEVDRLGLAVGDPERVPHRVVTEVGDVRDARRDFRAAHDGAVGRGQAEKQAGIGLVTDHQGAVAHPGDGLQPAVEGPLVNGRKYLRLAVTRRTQPADLLFAALDDEVDVTGRRIQGYALAVQSRHSRILDIERRGLT